MLFRQEIYSLEFLAVLSYLIMKQQDLHYPHSFKERKPVFLDQVLFVPRHYFSHEEWQIPIFLDNRPLYIEYCSGNGEWIIDKAKAFPNVNWVAVEKKFDRVRKIWVKAKNQGIKNLVVVAGEAETYAKFYLKPESVDRVFVNFPDPWPKDRHAKHRIIQTSFIQMVSNSLKPDALVTLVTDDTDYKEQMTDVMEKSALFSLSDDGPSLEEYGSSYFHRLWVSKGKEIHYLKFKKL
jgi:tRNA (guanine-N7-)-methyltransferase